jgi:hypothetical protein
MTSSSASAGHRGLTGSEQRRDDEGGRRQRRAAAGGDPWGQWRGLDSEAVARRSDSDATALGGELDSDSWDSDRCGRLSASDGDRGGSGLGRLQGRRWRLARLGGSDRWPHAIDNGSRRRRRATQQGGSGSR